VKEKQCRIFFSRYSMGAQYCAILQLSIIHFGNSGDFGNVFCDPLPAFFSQPPTRGKTFVANKRQSTIRPSGHRAVEALFRDDFAFDLADR
jgi:hypothetical protein